MEKKSLLQAVRKGIEDTRNGETSQIRRIAKEPEFFIDKVNKISDEHLKVLDELETWDDAKFMQKWDEYILDSGAGAYKFLADMLAIDKETNLNEK